MARIPSFEEYRNIVENSELLQDGKIIKREAHPRHLRILSCMLPYDFSGPTLDVASGSAEFYPAIKRFKPNMLPYSVTDLYERELVCDGEKIKCYKFECEKERIPLEDRSISTILFCDTIEHLIVDPIWVLLEFNRILKDNGRLVISTPNATYIGKIFLIFQGLNSATEHHIKPTSIYQRHNREWTLRELSSALTSIGFSTLSFSTHPYLLSDIEKSFLETMRLSSLTTIEDREFGPEIYYLVEKVKHVTLDSDLDIQDRWPDWLYTHYPNYRRRPKVFPIITGDDYG